MYIDSTAELFGDELFRLVGIENFAFGSFRVIIMKICSTEKESNIHSENFHCEVLFIRFLENKI